jgi:hypothetical protein
MFAPSPRKKEQFSLTRHDIPARSQRTRPIVSEMQRCKSSRPGQPVRSLTPHERMALEIPRYSVAGLFVTNHCGDIDLEEHAGYGKATDHEKRIGRDWTVAVRLSSTLRNIRLIANVGDVDHLFDCIR